MVNPNIPIIPSLDPSELAVADTCPVILRWVPPQSLRELWVLWGRQRPLSRLSLILSAHAVVSWYHGVSFDDIVLLPNGCGQLSSAAGTASVELYEHERDVDVFLAGWAAERKALRNGWFQPDTRRILKKTVFDQFNRRLHEQSRLSRYRPFGLSTRLSSFRDDPVGVSTPDNETAGRWWNTCLHRATAAAVRREHANSVQGNRIQRLLAFWSDCLENQALPADRIDRFSVRFGAHAIHLLDRHYLWRCVETLASVLEAEKKFSSSAAEAHILQSWKQEKADDIEKALSTDNAERGIREWGCL